MSSTPQWVAMGYIKGAFGIRGWVKTATDTEYVDSLLDYPEWQLRKDDHIVSAMVESGKVVGGELQVKFVGVDDRDQAHALRGYTIEIRRNDFAPTKADEYYWADLVGLSVFNRSGICLGKVSKLMETGAHDVLVIDGEYGNMLIPFVSHFIDQVDVAAGRIEADWEADY